MTWFLLVLSSAVSWSFTHLFAKPALTGLPVPAAAWARVAFPLPMLALGVALLCSVTAALGTVAVVSSSPQTFALVYSAALAMFLGP